MRRIEITECSCLAQYSPVPCSCLTWILWDLDEEADTRLGIRLDPEIFRDTGVCIYCGCVESECECLQV